MHLPPTARLPALTDAGAAGSGVDLDVDVAVVGGGVLGTAIAARVAATTASVCLLEAESDVAEGASKGNAGVAVAYYGPPGTDEAELITASHPGWEELAARLSVPYRRLGAVMVALDDEQVATLERTRDEVRACGARAELLTSAQARQLEPLITTRCAAGLAMPDEGVIDPMALTVAYAQLAARNGAVIRLNSPVTSIEADEPQHSVLVAPSRVRARFVVNAAGVAAGRVSAIAGGEKLTYWPRKGQYAVLDRVFASSLSRIVFSTHSATTKGVNVIPTTHGSALVGPTAEDQEDPGDKATDPDTIERLIASAATLVPAISGEHVIKYFAANRPASDEQHRLRFDAAVPNLLHCTNRSAGVSISPAAAHRALELLRNAGLDARERADAVDALPPAPRLRATADPAGLIRADPQFGQVVCVCEQVSAAEINRALAGPVPATSMEGVRKRTGAMYGRCQGSLCSAGIAFMTGVHTGTGPATVRQTARGTVGS
jgi:glycerol-3-phosphate dehydrogenase